MKRQDLPTERRAVLESIDRERATLIRTVCKMRKSTLQRNSQSLTAKRKESASLYAAFNDASEWPNCPWFRDFEGADALERWEAKSRAMIAYGQTDEGRAREAVLQKARRADAEIRTLEHAERIKRLFLDTFGARPNALCFEQWEPGVDTFAESRHAKWRLALLWVRAVLRDEWTGDPKPVLALVSSRKGTGKTHLATAAAVELAMRGKRVERWTIGELFAAVRESFDDPKSRGAGLVERCQRTDVFVLDDLGSHRGTDWEMDQLFTIFNHRYAAQKPTIVTSNAVPDTGDAWLAMVAGRKCEHRDHAERIASRLVEDGVLVRFADKGVEWPDWRATKGGKR